MITYDFDLDIVPGGMCTVVRLSQYDDDFELKIRLFARKGAFTVQSGTTAAIRGTKPDGNGFSADATIDGTTVAVPGDKQMTAVAGISTYELTLYRNGKELNSANFSVNVERAALDKDTVASDSKLREFTEVWDRADEIIAAGEQYEAAETAMRECAKEAIEAAEAAKASAKASSDTQKEIQEASEQALKTINEKATAVAQIATYADQTAAQALEKATNAENDVADDQGQLDALKEADEAMKLSLKGKVDGAFVEGGYLYLTANNETVAGPLGPLSGTGGGSTGNNATLTVTNASGWLSKTIASGGECPISVTWSSVEDDMPTGNGTMRILVNGVEKTVMDLPQGAVNVDIAPYLTTGSNIVKATISDVYDNSRTINFSVSVVSISISSTFDASTPYTGPILFTYTPVGSVRKTVHFILDGKEIGTAETSVSGRQQSYVIPVQSHGAHTFRCYFDCNINGQTAWSNELYYEIICLEALNPTPIIVSDFNTDKVKQYTTLHISYTVYDPMSITAPVEISVNGKAVSRQTVDRTQQVFTYRADEVGSLQVKIVSRSESKTLDITVEESGIVVEPETDQLKLYLSSAGRSNNEEYPGIWTYGEIAAVFNGFNFTSDGWQRDADGITVLRVSGDARVSIPYKPFASDFRATGKTFELEFATRNVMDYDAVIMSCLSGGKGFYITAQKALLKSEQSEISTQYKEDEHVRIAFVVEKRADNRLIYCYINGIMSGAIQYPADDDFAQAEPVDISIGSNDCTIDLYCIRVYDSDLTRHQILNNWTADTQTVDDMLSRYQRNNVYDEYGNVVIAQLPSDLPYLILECDELPQYKGDKKTVKGTYVNPAAPAKSFTFVEAQADVQGTSSQYYARKNYKIKFKDGFTLNNGTKAETYQLRGNSIGTNTFTFKADVASSEGANNVELARLYNDSCPYKTPPQVENPNIRQGIDGFPIVIFWNNGTETSFLGKYNFNNDKGTPETFGFSEGDESWEILNNTSDRVLWKSDDFTGTDWQNDFEARYPEDNTNVTNLAALSTWLVSTDQSAVQSESEKAARLQKFKNELETHMEKDAVLFYYLFTELFLMVDSRAKNAFPTAFLSQDGKWFSLPYDFDTAIGINNEGALVFGYNLEDIDTIDGGADVYNGQQSVLWVNLRQAFYDDLKTMYQTLRSSGALSYQDTENRFEEHQAKWPEAIFNEDAWFKYLAPLVESGSAAYLSMLQGSKAEQRKWWLYNRFRYLDSKYNAGDALTDVITVRGYAKANITVTPYADVYTSVKYGSYLVQERASRNTEHTLVCPLDNVNDTEIYIYSASQLASVGDLSGLMVGYAEFSMATKLQSLKIGDAASDYSNGNLTELHLGNNVLLKTIDVRNCPNLVQAVDISGCINIEEVYFDGSSITGLLLPNGGILKKLHLPQTITNLTIRNQTALTELSIPSYSNISTLRLENVSAAVNSRAMLETIPANSRVRIIGFAWEANDADEIFDLMDIMDTMRGLDENGNNMDKAQLSGTIHLDAITGADLARMNARYPNITITYDHVQSYCYFYNYDGSTLLYTATCKDGADAVYSGSTPSRSSTAQYTYAFAGWSKQANGSADSNALKAVTADRNVYAAFTATIRKYTVYFYNGSTLLQTVQNVAYGSSATYTGTTPVSPDGSPEDYPFEGWSPAPTNIQGNTSCYAQFGSPLEVKEIEDSWEQIIAAVNDGSYKTKYSVGNYKPLDLGSEGIVNMQISGKDSDPLADGTGNAPLSWISKELLKTSRRMNPSIVTNYDESTKDAWIIDESISGWKSNNQSASSSSATATWSVTSTTAGTLNISYKVGSEANYDKLTVKVNNETIANAISGNLDWTDYEIACSAGDTVTVTATYAKDGSGDQNGDTAYIRISSTGTIEITPNLGTITIRTVRDYQEGTGTIGGWEKTEMRTYLKETIKPLIPETVRNSIKTVSKTQIAYDSDGKSFTQTSQDDIWIPDYNEVFSGKYKTLFPDNASRIKQKAGSTSASNWWLRYANGTTHFRIVYSSGSYNSSNANGSYGVCLGFST